MSNPEIFSDAVEFIVDNKEAALGLLVIGLAFSRKTRQKIYERDDGKSRWSGKGGRLHAAHINHDKDSDYYDDESNGRLLTIGEHMWDHINRAGRNGLDERTNNWAIRTLWEMFWK